ncbi:GNAT family N-acetyltransferase [Streptomyces doebereineriae]|uniref:GNAT family N-acetyltransferase n=1 Tax=Streptomyces doebereineriae TaxID=3075528 RepID=A0ABU2V1J3_9ACTN|nr:GNAT family N-acetyltransferase [Streptomyces sp. DSM 41640]MDT0479419.1 GNAT family N-acetyltransferase [Streptomyces sp. DSM 41640]
MDELTHPKVIAQQLANAREFWLGYGAEGRRRSGLFMYRSGVADAQLNGVVTFSGGSFKSALEEAETAFSGLPWLWWVGPDSRPGVVGDLESHRFSHVGSMPVMAIRLDRVRRPSPTPSLEVNVVEDAAELAEWVRCWTWAFGMDTDLTAKILRIEAARPESPGRLTRFAARLDGRIVGTAALYSSQGVAGVYVVSTLKEHRGRGIGMQLTAAALQAGHEQGLSIGTLQASSLGLRVYERMGFAEVSRYRLFAARNAEPARTPNAPRSVGPRL